MVYDIPTGYSIPSHIGIGEALAVGYEDNSLVDANLENAGKWVVTKAQLYFTSFRLLQHIKYLRHARTEKRITGAYKRH